MELRINSRWVMNSNENRLSSGVWYALQTFYQKELEVESFLREQGYQPFIPRLYREITGKGGKKSRQLVPAVHNLLFLSKHGDGREQARLLVECPVPVRLMCHRDTGLFYEIPDQEMMEFRAICDPEFSDTLYTTRDFAEARPGKLVRVIHGHFKGRVGKLVRFQGHYYMVVCLVDLGVFLRISRWYCEPLAD